MPSLFANGPGNTVFDVIRAYKGNTVNPDYANDSDGFGAAQVKADAYMALKKRKPFTIEYVQKAPDTWRSITLYINPERLSMQTQKIKGKAITRGGIFFHHYGDDVWSMTLTGTTGYSGMKGIQALEEAYAASGTLLRYQDFGPKKIAVGIDPESDPANDPYISSPTTVFSDVLATQSNSVISNIESRLTNTDTQRQQAWETYLNNQRQIDNALGGNNQYNDLLRQINTLLSQWKGQFYIQNGTYDELVSKKQEMENAWQRYTASQVTSIMVGYIFDKTQTNIPIYELPNKGSKVRGYLAPQIVNDIISYNPNTGWCQIESFAGAAWVAPDTYSISRDNVLNLTQTTNIYQNGTVVGALAPQTVKSDRVYNNWYRINSYMGIVWINGGDPGVNVQNPNSQAQQLAAQYGFPNQGNGTDINQAYNDAEQAWNQLLSLKKQIETLQTQVAGVAQIQNQQLATQYGFPTGTYQELVGMNVSAQPVLNDLRQLSSQMLGQYKNIMDGSNFLNSMTNIDNQLSQYVSMYQQQYGSLPKASDYYNQAFKIAQGVNPQLSSQLNSIIAYQKTLYYGDSVDESVQMTPDNFIGNLNQYSDSIYNGFSDPGILNQYNTVDPNPVSNGQPVEPVDYTDDITYVTSSFTQDAVNALKNELDLMADLENREKQYYDMVRNTAFTDILDDITDEWRPRRIFIYFENRVYVGHFDSFVYGRDSANPNYITYELRITIERQIIGD